MSDPILFMLRPITMALNLRDLVAERPHFGSKQVRSLSGIKPGLTLFKVNLFEREKILVVSEVISLRYNKFDAMYFKYVSLNPELYKVDGTAFLTDCGVIPYRASKKWNPINHLLRTGERRLNGLELEQAISRIGVKVRLLTACKVCVLCGEDFSTYNDSDKCFFCTLDEIVEGCVTKSMNEIATAVERSGTYAVYKITSRDPDEVENASPDIESDDFNPEDGWALLDWENEEWRRDNLT